MMFDRITVRTSKRSRLWDYAAGGLMLVAKVYLIATLLISDAQAFDIEGSGTVFRAVDGDTYWVSDVEPRVYRELAVRSGDSDHFNDRYRSVKIRLGAVDTAESVHPDAARNTLRGNSISDHMKEVAKGQAARFRCWDIGKYGRPICSISLANTGDIGLYLIKNGFSDYVTRWGTHPFMDAAYRAAASR